MDVMGLRRRIMMASKKAKAIVIWNNLEDGYMTSTYWQDRNTSDTLTTFANGIATTQFLSSTGSYKTMMSKVGVSTYKDHKYYCRMQCKINKDIRPYMTGMDAADIQWFTETAEVNEWGAYSNIVTGRADRTSWTYCPEFSTLSANSGLIAETKNVLVVDLTLMFGAGNEPATTADFEALCALNGVDLNTPQSKDVSGTELMWII